MPKQALARLHELSRKSQAACPRDPKPWNFAIVHVADEEPSPEITSLRNVAEEEESEQERIDYSLSALELGKFLYDKYFDEYWVERGMPGSCRCPPKKNKEGQINGHDCFVPVPENNKKEHMEEKREEEAGKPNDITKAQE